MNKNDIEVGDIVVVKPDDDYIDMLMYIVQGINGNMADIGNDCSYPLDELEKIDKRCDDYTNIYKDMKSIIAFCEDNITTNTAEKAIHKALHEIRAELDMIKLEEDTKDW